MPFVFDGRHLLICFIVAAVVFVVGIFIGWTMKKESMRISVKITSWQDNWYPRFPRIDLDAVRKSGEERLICERHCNGYCAPCKFDCSHYNCGKCVEIK